MRDEKRTTRRILPGLIFLMLSLCTASAYAQTIVNVSDFSRAVPGDSRIAYVDLIRKVFPDAHDEAGETGLRAGKTIALNHLFGDYKRRVFAGEMSINSASALRIKSLGRERLLLLLSAESADGDLFQWGAISVLALFGTGHEITLLDAVDVQADRFTFFPEKQPVLRVSREDDAVLIVNHHFNSGDGYLAYSIIGVVEDRLKDIFEDMPLLVADNHCGTNFTETPHFRILNSSRNGHRKLRLRIELRKQADGPRCERRTRGFTRYFDYALVWHPLRKRYVGGLNATRRLRAADRTLGFEL